MVAALLQFKAAVLVGELEKNDLVSVFIPFTHLKFKKQLLYTLTE